MTRKPVQRISYILPLANSGNATGHRLGVNGLAVDKSLAILYSGGRDGVLCAWDLNVDLTRSAHSGRPRGSGSKPNGVGGDTRLVQQVQAHTHWINDVVLAHNNSALVSASSDISVKVWRPGAGERQAPQTIGLHSDYVKCLASAGPQSGWVASGGLDHKINVWDLHGAGRVLQIALDEDERGSSSSSSKGSVYALAATGSIIVSGGPESVLKLWDVRSGRRIGKLVGHTDNIRDVLIGQDGDVLLTASSDQTVKAWSVGTGRCVNTLTMHNDSVWSLYSDHARLAVFYSADRSGLVARTDWRHCVEVNDGVCVAVCQEHSGINKVVSAGDHLWTATFSSSINRWADADIRPDARTSDYPRRHRNSVASARAKEFTAYPGSPTAAQLPSATMPQSSPRFSGQQQHLPAKSILPLSHTIPSSHRQAKEQDSSTIRTAGAVGRTSESFLEEETASATPYNISPDYTIEGQNGLIKHVLLNDRRRVLTMDTAGDVMLWDLLKCIPIKSYGKCHMDDKIPELTVIGDVAHWCAVDTRIGSLTCVLEYNHCFDAEVYADELDFDERIDFKEDQRINVGKWVLRYLFSSLIDEEIRRDERYRQALLLGKSASLKRVQAPDSIKIPSPQMNGWYDGAGGVANTATPRAGKGMHSIAVTPGFGIKVATPGLPLTGANLFLDANSPRNEDATPQDKKTAGSENRRRPLERSTDYFSSTTTTSPTSFNSSAAHERATQSTSLEEAATQSAAEPEKETPSKEGGALFGKKLRMAFGLKKSLKLSTSDSAKAAASDDKAEDSDSKSSQNEDHAFEDNFLGRIQRIRHKYREQVQQGARSLVPNITPSLPNETPVLKPPANTTILIQEEQPDQGGIADLFEGTVKTVGQQADLIEKVAPTWLADLLLCNQMPVKDVPKIYFVLEPYQASLPEISAPGFNRLNASRMLRARKILHYIADRIEPAPEKVDPNALRPEEYLELYCQSQLVPPSMNLATIRSHIWRGSGDILLLYRANGRKRITDIKSPPPPPPDSAEYSLGG